MVTHPIRTFNCLVRLLPLTALFLLPIFLNSNIITLNLIQPTLETPLPLSSIYTAPTSVPAFTVPQVIRTYYNISNSTLHIYANGIELPSGGRNLRSVACAVDSCLYDAYLSAKDAVHCVTPAIKPGARISIGVLRDDEMRRQERENTTLTTGVVVSIQPGEFQPVPAHYAYNSSKYDREDLRLVAHGQAFTPPEAEYNATRGSGDKRRRWKYCLLTQIAPFSEYLPQWVRYHRRIGIDHVYIFDNGAKNNLTAMFYGRPDVEVLQWPYRKSQIALISWFFRVARPRCRYVMHMDVDEFIMVPLGTKSEYNASRPLDAAMGVARAHGYVSMKFLWVTMKNNGLRKQPTGYLAEVYTQRHEKQRFENGKSLCSTDVTYDSGLVHNCGLCNGAKTGRFMRSPGAWEELRTPTKRGDVPYLVHFRERCWADWIEKMRLGSATALYMPNEKTRKLTLDKPPKYYMEVKKELQWTGFRGVWRRVMKEGGKWENVAEIIGDGGVHGGDDGERGECVRVRVRKGRFVKVGACR